MSRPARQAASGTSGPTLFHAHLEQAGPGATLELSADEAGHARTLRLRAEAPVRITDGKGAAWSARVVESGRRRTTCRLEALLPAEGPTPVDLWMPVAHRDRSLWLVEKAVELGVRSISWVVWGRSASVADAGRSAGFAERARRRALAALKQSGGAHLPELSEPVGLALALGRVPADTARWLADAEGEPLLQAAREGDAREASILIGPEGGARDEERTACLEAGFRPVSLGPRTLRFETAALVALALARAAFAETEHDARKEAAR